MQQVLVIHGGGTFIPRHGESPLEIIATKTVTLESLRRGDDWKAVLQKNLGPDFDVLSPRMPNADAPRYEEWCAWFEKILPLLDKTALFVGHSLGALFLAKYFSEQPKFMHAKALFLVAAPFDGIKYGWEHITLSTLSERAERIFLYHSSDDEVVLPRALDEYAAQLPKSVVRRLTGRGHFNTSDFPELIEDIKTL